MQDKIWTTKDGKKIHLKKMGDRHLDNCIAMMKRGINHLCEEHHHFSNEEDLFDMFESSCNIELLDLQLRVLTAEKKRRLKEGSYEKPIKKWDCTILKEGVKNG